ncbi:MAG: hypothetical protein ACYC8T_22380 [Myxococcaceae bacterium]
MRRWSLLALVAVSLSFLAGCGGNPAPSACPGPSCTCTGAACSCQAGASCNWGSGPDGGAAASQSLACLSGNNCSGACLGSCSADCKGSSTCTLTTGESGSISCDKSSCTLTVGKSGSVSCTNGSTCNVTCTEKPCSLSCAGDSTCKLTCPGAAAKAVTGSGEC